MTPPDDRAFMAQAMDEARASIAEGGSPIGAVLVKDGTVLGRGRNRLFQDGDPTSHAEMEAYRNAARRLAETHDRLAAEDAISGGTVYTTAMPCEMCAGAIIRFNAVRVVVGETASHPPPATRPLMERQGIEVAVLDDAQCTALVEDYLAVHPDRREQWLVPRTAPLKL